MKRLVTMSIALVMSMLVFADGDYSLYIAAEKTTSHKISAIQKLTFENGNVVVNLKDGTKESTAITSVNKMYFRIAATIIQDVNKDGVVDTQDALSIYSGMESGETDGLDVNEDGVVDTQDVLNVYEYMENN